MTNQIIRRGASTVWKKESISSGVAVAELPALPPSEYLLEASVNGQSRSLRIDLASRVVPDTRPFLSFNANLDSASRLSFLGRQEARRNQIEDARGFYTKAGNRESVIGLSRIDAMQGRLDEARERLRPVLAADPNNYDALLAMAYIEARFQDLPAADAYYQRALAVLR